MPPEAHELLERCLIVKTQRYTYSDFVGYPCPPPTDWLKETQMGLEELSAHEARLIRDHAKRQRGPGDD